MTDNKLTDGRIPPHTVCPYESACIIAEHGYCQHKGEDHIVSYSCGIARTFEIEMEDVANESNEPYLT